MTPHDPCHVANYFINRGKEDSNPFTPLQIQKLAYFSHGWTLGAYHRPLLDREFEAWMHGPVMPVIYHNLSYYGGAPVEKPILAHARDFDGDEDDILNQIYNYYGQFDGVRLSRMTHAKDGPWDQTWRRHKRQAVIPDKVIEKYFKDIIRRAS